ncbi:hypothetical protein [Olsenella sp. HMSC062G07]|uniref:hypothetical protein n=1 Tax=Olsenella sp. HMSC062G07 TaxID=1739330 RepID=UPI0008A5527B|nr:hypothetical protein [Olsenella sp. HMSC062G07]OFK24394.1 hypothetical protein HMPREF2826_07310 [Olsenella sp. HMSC062G07]
MEGGRARRGGESFERQKRERPKAEFRALRETVGMTQGFLASVLMVGDRSVRRWEGPDDRYYPPDDAWDLVDAALRRQRRVVALALARVDETARERGGYPDVVTLTYWPSDEQHVAGSRVPDGGDWRMANANSRLIAFALRRRGVRVAWSDGPTAPGQERIEA